MKPVAQISSTEANHTIYISCVPHQIRISHNMQAATTDGCLYVSCTHYSFYYLPLSSTPNRYLLSHEVRVQSEIYCILTDTPEASNLSAFFAHTRTVYIG